MNYHWGSLTNFIIGSDSLVNVDSKNRDDKNLWYFKSPLITLKKQPFGMTFSIASFVGDFTKLNSGFPPVVKITTNDGVVVRFNKAVFGGHINVPFVQELWECNRDFSFKHVFAFYLVFGPNKGPVVVYWRLYCILKMNELIVRTVVKQK